MSKKSIFITFLSCIYFIYFGYLTISQFTLLYITKGIDLLNDNPILVLFNLNKFQSNISYGLGIVYLIMLISSLFLYLRKNLGRVLIIVFNTFLIIYSISEIVIGYFIIGKYTNLESNVMLNLILIGVIMLSTIRIGLYIFITYLLASKKIHHEFNQKVTTSPTV